MRNTAIMLMFLLLAGRKRQRGREKPGSRFLGH